MTASADKTAKLWDPLSGTCLQTLEGHTDEIFSCAFNYEGDTIITGMLCAIIVRIVKSCLSLNLSGVSVVDELCHLNKILKQNQETS